MRKLLRQGYLVSSIFQFLNAVCAYMITVKTYINLCTGYLGDFMLQKGKLKLKLIMSFKFVLPRMLTSCLVAHAARQVVGVLSWQCSDLD